jgi:hypothetical protein
MKHLTSALIEGYVELLSFCECTRRLTEKNLLEEPESNEILSDLADEMTLYESLFVLLGIESPQIANFNKKTFHKFVEIYSPEVIQGGHYTALESLIFN